MALKQSSSFASLRSKFRKSSSSSVKGQDEDAHSPGSLSRAPTNHSTASSSASKRPGLFRSFSSSSGKDGNNSSSSTNGNGNSANRWADAPPLPAPSNKSTKPEKLPLGYVPPASPGSMSSPRSEGPPFSGKAGPSSPNTLAPRQHLSAAEQGANLRHRSQSQGASTMESMQRRSQYITQGAPPLPGQRTSASQPVTPPAANARARTQSSSQGAKERPRSVSASNPSQKSRDQPKDAAAKLKNRVSITPGKDSWAQVQAREQRAKYSSQYGAPPPSEDQKRYTGYGSGSLAPERANSQSSRYSYAAPSSSSPYRQSSIQSASSNPHHPDQMLYNHNAAAGGQRQMDGPPGPRTRSMYAGNHPGQLSPAGLSPTSPQMVKYPHPPSALLSPGGPSPHLLPHGGANAAVDSPSTLGDPTSPGSTVSPIRSVSDSVFPDPPSHVPSSQASNAETIMSPVHSVSSPATSVFPPEPLLAPFSPLQPRSSPIFAILPPAFPPRPISQCYASCYCEENAYRLVQALLQRPPFSTGLSVASHLSDGLGLTGADPNPSDATLNADRVLDTMYQHAGLRWAVHVIFASNEGQNVALFAQRAGAEAGRGDGLVIWD
ncbi:hypothetical protein OC846_000878 [Tilletia horrida]|uniref:Protein N-terminal glutamine amidohydrolase n=1 Tax=Tilletia horrida TaxID=155126 RepID=A0AAN6GX23_9BASI|nr:hypothetical protein OC846_000878 [Tilletia horrida]